LVIVTPAFDELADLLSSPVNPPLDRCAALVAAAARPPVHVVDILGRLDDIAESVDVGDVESLHYELFMRQRLRGNRDDYGDPRNSYLDMVLTRSLGLPITLSIVAIEVARRANIFLAPIALPGHFVCRTSDGRLLDAFHDGRWLDSEGIAQLLQQPVRPEWFEPASSRAVLWRMLGNLQATFVQRDDPIGLAWVTRLRCQVIDEHAALAALAPRFN
jgi:regulator of sirC expression with transglutaminase-like and TPR domain